MMRSLLAVFTVFLSAGLAGAGDEKPLPPVEARKQVGKKITVELTVATAKDRQAGTPPGRARRPGRSLALSSDDKILASAGRDGTLNPWDLVARKSGEPRFPILASRKEGVLGFQVAAFAPDARTLATGGIDRNVTLWNVEALIAQGSDGNGKKP